MDSQTIVDNKLIHKVIESHIKYKLLLSLAFSRTSNLSKEQKYFKSIILFTSYLYFIPIKHRKTY